MDHIEEKITDRWEFDNWNCKAGLPSSAVELWDSECGQRVNVVVEGKTEMTIDADLDQWGTWLTFRIGQESFTVAQESETRSFFGALMAAMEKMKGLADCGDPIAPTHTNHESKETK